MEPALVLAAAVGVVLGGVGVLAARRARMTARRTEARLASDARELERRLAISDADRRSTDLTLAAMREGVVLFAGDGRRLFANPAIEEHLSSLPGSVDDLSPVGIRDAVRHTRVTHLSSEAEVQTGSPIRWLRASATPVGDDDSVLLVVRDVTEARRLDAMRRDFVANASHELKTPVASILAAAETIHDAASDDPAVLQRFSAQLEGDAIRLSRIISDLLDLSRLEGGSDTDAAVDLDAILSEELERFGTAAEAAGVDVRVDAEPVQVRGSARDLALLVRNLVDNALRYTPRGGHVDLTMRLGDEEAILEVADSGIGIPTRDLPRVFERFYRVDRARSRETGGTGLGLAIVKHVVENHGGQISVTSELGNGTRFEVRLPAAG